MTLLTAWPSPVLLPHTCLLSCPHSHHPPPVLTEVQVHGGGGKRQQRHSPWEKDFTCPCISRTFPTHPARSGRCDPVGGPSESCGCFLPQQTSSRWGSSGSQSHTDGFLQSRILVGEMKNSVSWRHSYPLGLPPVSSLPTMQVKKRDNFCKASRSELIGPALWGST